MQNKSLICLKIVEFETRVLKNLNTHIHVIFNIFWISTCPPEYGVFEIEITEVAKREKQKEKEKTTPTRLDS